MRKILVLALATMLFGAACQKSEETAPPAAPEASAAPAEASPAAAEASPAAPEASPAAPAPATSPAATP